MQKVRVLHLLSSNIFSGAENEVCHLIEVMNKSMEMAYCSPKGVIEDELKKRCVNFYGIDKMSRKNVNEIIEKYKPDIVHAHDYTASVIATSSKFKGEIISHIHHSPEFVKKWNFNSILYLLCCKKITSIAVVSNSIMSEAIFERYIKNKIVKISNYIDEKNVITKSNEPRKFEDNLEYDVAYIGRLEKCKNPLGFIEIINLINKHIPGIRGVMIGDGVLKNECHENIISLRLENNIIMTGYLENPYNILKKSKIIIIPSKREGFGLVALEAMILGKPIVASNVGGLIELIKSECGFLCNSKQEFVDYSVQLLSQPDLYECLSKNAVKRYGNLVNKENFQRELEELYSSIY